MQHVGCTGTQPVPASGLLMEEIILPTGNKNVIKINFSPIAGTLPALHNVYR